MAEETDDDRARDEVAGGRARRARRAGPHPAVSLPGAHDLGRRRPPGHARVEGRHRALPRNLLRQVAGRTAPTRRATTRAHTPTARSRCTAAPTTSSTRRATGSAPRRSRAPSCATSCSGPIRRSATSSSSARRTKSAGRRRWPSSCRRPGARSRPTTCAGSISWCAARRARRPCPSDYLVVSQFPETRSGKYMRRMLRALLLDEPLGDTSTLRNPESIDEIPAGRGGLA